MCHNCFPTHSSVAIEQTRQREWEEGRWRWMYLKDTYRTRALGLGGRHIGQKLYDLLSVLRFASSRFASTQNRLVFTIYQREWDKERERRKKYINMGNNIIIFLKRNVQMVNGLKLKMADKVCCLFVSFRLFYLFFFTFFCGFFSAFCLSKAQLEIRCWPKFECAAQKKKQREIKWDSIENRLKVRAVHTDTDTDTQI